MKLSWLSLVAGFVFLVSSCSTGQRTRGKFELSPAEFAQKLKDQPNAIVLDVRSPEEFADGSLPHARNVDWNGPDFESEVATLPKTEPIYVYCLSGGRSASAAAHLRKAGFNPVYEMVGGLIRWRAEGIQLNENSSAAKKPKGIQPGEFEAMLISDKTILVDFYAVWCGPCKKMKPDLDWLAKEKATSLTVIRIDADANPDLAKKLGVAVLPTVFIFKNKKEVSRKEGYLSRADMEALL